MVYGCVRSDTLIMTIFIHMRMYERGAHMHIFPAKMRICKCIYMESNVFGTVFARFSRGLVHFGREDVRILEAFENSRVME